MMVTTTSISIRVTPACPCFRVLRLLLCMI
jgi:hypothetical protein